MRVLLSPRAWGAHVLMVLAVTAAVLLGLWQLAAWEAAREAEARDLSDADPVALLEAMDGDDPFPGEYVGQPVRLAGDWLPEGTSFVADRRNDASGGSDGGAEDGYWVMTPVVVEGADDGAGGPSAMPVVRGWSPEPAAPEVDGRVELTGWLQPSEGSGEPDPDRSDDVIPEMRVASLTERVDVDLFSGFVVAQEPTGSLTAVTPDQIPDVSPITSLRNLLYGVQWWLFGLFALYVWQRWCRDQLELASTDLGDTDAEDEQRPVGSTA